MGWSSGVEKGIPRNALCFATGLYRIIIRIKLCRKKSDLKVNMLLTLWSAPPGNVEMRKIAVRGLFSHKNRAKSGPRVSFWFGSMIIYMEPQDTSVVSLVSDVVWEVPINRKSHRLSNRNIKCSDIRKKCCSSRGRGCRSNAPPPLHAPC